MLILVHFFVFEMVEAIVLCVTSHKRKGSFTQVILQKSVAGMYQMSVFGLEITRLFLLPGKTGILR